MIGQLEQHRNINVQSYPELYTTILRDTFDQSRVLEILGEKIADPRFLHYLARLFKAGALSQGELRSSDEGVVQCSACSPVLADIFAHSTGAVPSGLPHPEGED